jgi:hypothetical protein
LRGSAPAEAAAECDVMTIPDNDNEDRGRFGFLEGKLIPAPQVVLLFHVGSVSPRGRVHEMLGGLMKKISIPFVGV